MFTIEVETGNAAFHEQVHDDFFDEDTAFSFLELARILQQITDAVRSGKVEGQHRDFNGNTVCRWSLKDA